METIEVFTWRDTAEKLDFELDDEALEYRDTILECEKTFSVYYGTELVVWQPDYMICEMEDAVADQANMEVFADIPGARNIAEGGKVIVTAGSVAHGKACELWETILNESFILDEGRYFELLQERREQLAKNFVTEPTYIFGPEVADILMTVVDLDQRLEVMVDLMTDEEMDVSERVKGL